MNPRLPAPDFLRPVRRPGLLAWAWCITGLLVLAAAALDGGAAWSARQQALEQRATAQRRTDRLPAAAAPAVDAAAAGAGPALSPAPRQAPGLGTAAPIDGRRAEAQRWLQRLAHPWPQVWAASEAASVSGVAWLGLEHGERGTLRLAGLAADAGAAFGAAQALREATGSGGARWRDVVLTRIEKVPDGLHFELSAQLAEPLPAPASPPAADAGTRSPGAAP